MIRFEQSSPSFGAEEFCDPLSVEGQRACWRDPSADVITERLGTWGAAATLANLVAMVRPAARELAHILDRDEPAALVGSALDGDRCGVIPPANLADDLLASALLIEGICGDPKAQLVVDHMRGRRGLHPLVWSNDGARRYGPRKARTRKRQGNQQKITASSDPALP